MNSNITSTKKINYTRVIAVAIAIVFAINSTSNQRYNASNTIEAISYVFGQFLISFVIALVIELLVFKKRK